jgi:hypothetical protein
MTCHTEMGFIAAPVIHRNSTYNQINIQINNIQIHRFKSTTARSRSSAGEFVPVHGLDG